HVRHAATLLRLPPLPADAGIELLAASVGERVVRDGAAAGRLAALCAGLPLALRIVAERLVSRPALTLAGLAAELGDERSRLESLSSLGEVSVRVVFSWSYRALDELAAGVF